MNSAYVYLQVYRLFDNVTPLKVDCGGLCGSACCKGDDETGMLLFPGEEGVFKLLKPEGMRIKKSKFRYECNGRELSASVLVCDGDCDRFARPLACRIFPLAPVLTPEGTLAVKPDPRAKRVCPLAKAFGMSDYRKYNDTFVSTVKKAFILLKKNRYVYGFLRAYTDYIAEYEKFFA